MAQSDFIGQDPASTIATMAELAQRQAALFQQGIQQGMQNYLAQKQMKQQKDIAEKQLASQEKQDVNATERLRLTMIQKDIGDALASAGPGNEGKVFLDKEKQYEQLFSFYANGDAELADHMKQGYAQQVLGSLSPSSMLGMGMLGVQAAPASAQPAAPVTPVAAPEAAPAAAPAGAIPSLGQSQAAPPAAARPAELAAQPSQPSSATLDMTIGTGVGAMVQRSASMGFAKTLSGTATDQVTPKESAAMNQALKPMVSVLDNVATRTYLSKGGSIDHLAIAASMLEQALQSSPQMAEYLSVAATLPADEAKAYMSWLSQDRQMQQLLASISQQNKQIDLQTAQVLASAASDQAHLEQAMKIAELQARTAQNAQDAKTADDYQKAVSNAVAASNAYNKLYADERTQWMKAHAKASEEDTQRHMLEVLGDSKSAIYGALANAATLWSPITGKPAEYQTLTIKAVPGGWFGIGAKPAVSAYVPVLPNTQAQGQGAAPSAPSAPSTTTPGDDYAKRHGM